MSKATELRTQLDALDAEYVKLDQQITLDRERLYEIGKRRGELEREFQRADAEEAQAALDANEVKSNGSPSG